MNCSNNGIVGKIAGLSQPAIVKGSDAYIVTQNFDGPNCCPSEITGFQGATGFFENDDGTTLSASGELLSAVKGQLRFELTAAETALLKASDEASFEFALEDNNGLMFIQFDGKLQIKDRLF